jgi:aryl-alcohol dehydrogenase-like predicted oxidoreductase
MSRPESDQSTIALGRTGLRVSRLGVGAMVWGDMASAPRFDPARNSYGPTSTKEDQREALEASLAAGMNLVDTAAMYGKGASERRVGELIEGREVFVATKFPGSFFARDSSFDATLAGSLARLRREAIDLYQIHYPVPWMSIPRLMDHMADAVQAGKVRAVGVSNYSAAQTRTAHAALAKHGIPLASNQVQYSLLHRQPEVNGTLEACRELGITLIAYMPLASGALTGKYSATHRPEGWRRYRAPFRGKSMATVVAVNQLLREIAERYDRRPGQVALRWLIQQDSVLPIPGAKNRDQASTNAGALTFELTDKDVVALSRATQPA